MAETRNHVRSRGASLTRFALAIGLAIPLAATGSDRAAVAATPPTNVVTTTDDVIANDNQCSLREAIIAANTAPGAIIPTGECSSGRLTVELQEDATYVVDPALPPIVTSATLNGNNATIQSGAPLRVLQVGNDGGANIVEIRDLTLTHRHSVTGVTGRGLYVRSAAIVENLTVVDNREIGHGGGVYNENELEIIDSTVSDNGPVLDGVREGGGIYNEAGSTLTISGTTISNNEAQHGGGIANHGTLFLTASTISDNEALGSGGGLHNEGLAELESPTIGGNSAALEGGGVHNSGTGVLRLSDGEIAGNSALAGGGLRNLNEMSIDRAVVSGNEATSIDGFGGGIATTGSPTEIVDSVIANNEVLGSSGNGGGIEGIDFEIRDSSVTGNEAGRSGGGLHGSNATIERTTIDDNRAGATGGGAVASGSTIEASTISGNTAATRGGGLHLAVGSSVLNSTISGNTSSVWGGGIYVIKSTIRFSTITDNTAPVGSGLAHETSVSNTTIGASIVAGNHDGLDVSLNTEPGPQDDSINSLGYNIIGTIGDGVVEFIQPGDLVDADPKLDPLAENGGPTRTHQPQPDSPAIDHVTAPDPELQVGSEQRGLLRRPTSSADSGSVECCLRPFRPREPRRMVDTRPGAVTDDGEFAGDGPIEGGTVYEVTLIRRDDDLPEIEGDAIINLTTVDAVGNGFLTIYDCEEQPLASTINYSAGRTANNEVIVRLGESAQICIFAKTTTHLVIDLVGEQIYPLGQRPESHDRYRPVNPARLLETRSGPGLETIDGRFEGVGAIEGDTELELQVTLRDGAVIQNAAAVVVNLSTVGSLGNGFLTVYDCGDRPLASGINYSTDGVVNNEIITRVSERGTICIYAKTTTHVVVDLVGYLLPGSSYRAVTPARLVETRAGLPTIDGETQGGGPIAGDTMIEVPISGRGGSTSRTEFVVVNVSVLTGVGNGFLTVWNCDADQPLASAINYGPGRVVNNEIVVDVSEDGMICIYAKTTAHVVVDLVGFSARSSFISVVSLL